MSNNGFTDSYSELLSLLFTSKLKILILDKNNLEDSVFASELSTNRDLLHYSINSNPLKYSSVMDLLETLSENKTLQYLGLSGITFKGAAPIKENSSGLLDAQEGIILKLSYVLRSSSLIGIALDISAVYTLQLKELENTLIKYNKTLTAIESRFIDWDNLQTDSALMNIYLAMKANKWSAQGNNSPPSELREIIQIKEGFLENFHENPQFSNEISFGRHKRDSESRDLSMVKGYFDKVMEKIDEVDLKVTGKIEEIEKRLEVIERKKARDQGRVKETCEKLWKKLENIEKKLISRELAEDSLRSLESLHFNQPAGLIEVSSSRNNLEESVKQLLKRMQKVEGKGPDQMLEKSFISKFANFEDRLNQVEKTSDQYSSLHKSYNQTLTKMKKLEEIVNSTQNTPLKPKNDCYSPSKIIENFNKKGKVELGDECESIILGALLDRVNHSFRNSPERSVSVLSMKDKYKRAPSTDLKESLRLKGYTIDGHKPFTSASSFKSTYKKS